MEWVLVLSVLGGPIPQNVGPQISSINRVAEFPTKQRCVDEGATFQQVMLHRIAPTKDDAPANAVHFDCIYTGAGNAADNGDRSTTVELFETIVATLRTK